MKFIKFLTWLHRWLGIFLCVTILSISLTGTLLIWKKEYLWLSLPDARETIQRDAKSIAQTIEKITTNYAENELLLIQVHSENLSLHKAYIDRDKRAWYNQQGEIIDQWSENGRFEDWLLDLHHRFLLGSDIGLNIAGFSGLLLLAMLFLGITIWWPRRRAFKLGLLPSKFNNINKNELIRSHGNLGFIMFLPILIIGISGIVLTYPNQSRDWLLEPFLQDDNYQISEGPLDQLQGKDQAAWQNVLKRALLQYPNATIRWVSPESSFTPYRIVGLQQADSWNKSGRTTVYIDADKGYMDVNIDNTKRANIEQLYDFTYPLHTAKLGLWYRLLLSMIGLILFVVALFGCLSFFKK